MCACVCALPGCRVGELCAVSDDGGRRIRLVTPTVCVCACACVTLYSRWRDGGLARGGGETYAGYTIHHAAHFSSSKNSAALNPCLPAACFSAVLLYPGRPLPARDVAPSQQPYCRSPRCPFFLPRVCILRPDAGKREKNLPLFLPFAPHSVEIPYIFPVFVFFLPYL